jgi:kynurenine formamidase
MRLVELSHVIHPGMVTYPGFPGPEVTAYLTRDASRSRYAPGTTFEINRICLIGNTGTYVDAPVHRYAEGADLSGIPLDRLADLPGVVVPAAGPAIGASAFTGYPVQGRAVLVHTGWDQHWGTERYFEGHPYLTGALATWLVQSGAVLVGIDSLNIDGTDGPERPVHSTLLAHDVPVVEHLCGLAEVPERGGRFFAVPAKIKAFHTFPVRAFVLA